MVKQNTDMEDGKKEVLSIFSYYMNEIEALEAFFRHSQGSFNSYIKEIRKEYSSGYKLSILFNHVLEGKTVDECNSLIEKIKKERVDSSHTVEDVCHVYNLDNDANALRFSMKGEFAGKKNYNPSIANKRFRGLGSYSKFMIESFLSNVIVVFESFLSSIYRLLYEINPIKYLSNKTIKLVDMLNVDLSSFLAAVIDTEVESKMRDSLDAIEQLEKEENICIDRYNKRLLEQFSEIYYRRNAYVHTGGCVNKDYLKKVPNHYLKGLKEGDALVCDAHYCSNAIRTLSIIVFSIVFELLVKYESTCEEIEELSFYFFDKLVDRDYSLCEYAYFVLSEHKKSDFSHRMVYRINYLNCLKQLGRKEELECGLKALDVSATKIDFKVAKECLSDNNEAVYELLKEAYPSSFSSDDIKNWPIFIDFRKTEYYEKFRNEHKEDFDTDVVERQKQIEPEECGNK